MTIAPNDSPAAAFYRRALGALAEAGIPFLVGGAYALERYTGIVRDTKDLDIFVRPEDCEGVLRAFDTAGFETELTYPHWLGKAFSRGDMVDIIFSSGNGCARVDEEWFRHAVEADVLGMRVGLIPVEEMIWSKAFVMERERYDGADIAHLLRARAAGLDWPRLVRRFGPHWRVLLSHLVLFGFIYPGHRADVPERVMQRLIDRLARESRWPAPAEAEPLCRGTLLSRAQYLVDVEHWGYRDARLAEGTMSETDVACWTAAIEEPRPTESR
ncbi:MAG TPA: nucleotidyltransferase [Candidatus Binatia bacterium]|nr:nucleotidyltransferase [Candidatus Binatia bacterium]